MKRPTAIGIRSMAVAAVAAVAPLSGAVLAAAPASAALFSSPSAQGRRQPDAVQ